MQNRRFSYSSYQIFVFLLLVTWNRETLFQYVKSVVWRIPGISYGTVMYVFVFFSFLFIASWPYMKTKIRIHDILLYLFFAVVYGLSVLAEVDSFEYLMENAYVILFQIIPVVFIGLSIDVEDNHILDLMHITSIASIFLHLFSTFFLSMSVSEINDAMDLAYRIQPHVLLVGCYFLKEKKIIDLVSSVVGIISLIWFGSRGAFALTILFMIVYFVFFTKHSRKLYFYIVTSVAGVAMVIFSSTVFLVIRDFLAKIGIKTRIFDRIVEQTFFSSVGRNTIKELLWNAISNKPLTGYGIAGDRPICYGVGEVYAHSLYLEVFTSYGYIIGGFILALVAILLIRALYIARATWIRDFLLILIFSSGLLKLFLSSSYLLEYEFFLMIGICISVIRNYKLNIRDSNILFGNSKKVNRLEFRIWR